MNRRFADGRRSDEVERGERRKRGSSGLPIHTSRGPDHRFVQEKQGDGDNEEGGGDNRQAGVLGEQAGEAGQGGRRRE